MDRCPVCGKPGCQEELLMALVKKDTIGKAGEAVAEYVSKEHVYAKDERSGNTFLKYAPGDPIPEEEARRQGLVKSKREPDGHKAVRESPTKSRKE